MTPQSHSLPALHAEGEPPAPASLLSTLGSLCIPCTTPCCPVSPAQLSGPGGLQNAASSELSSFLKSWSGPCSPHSPSAEPRRTSCCSVLPRRRKLSAMSLQEPGHRELDRDVRLALKKCRELGSSLEKAVLGSQRQRESQRSSRKSGAVQWRRHGDGAPSVLAVPAATAHAWRRLHSASASAPLRRRAVPAE